MIDPIADSPYCVGRETELELVRGLLHAAAIGEGSALIWLGESGAGKTRLLRECTAMKTAAATLSIRCGGAAMLQLDLAALAARARRRPVALFLDDLHLADESELAVVSALSAMTQHHRVVVIGCAEYRDASEDAWRSLGATLRRLPPLDDAAVELLVRGLAGARTFATDHLHEIVKTAQGNPGLAIELVSGAIRPAGGAPFVPASTRAEVARLRAELSRPEFEIVLACSAIGDAFSGDWLPDVTGRSRADVADALQHASDMGVFVPAAWSPQWLAFRRVALRKALYASIVALKRRILHERIVDRIAGAQGDEGAAQVDVLLAHHAEIVGDQERASAAFARAADRSREAAAFSEAAELYARAATHSPRGEARWIELADRTMRCYSNSGNWRRMTSVAQSVVETVDPARDPATVGNALENLFFAQLNDGGQEAAEQTAQRIAALGLPNSEIRGRIANLILAYNLCYSARLSEASRLVATVEPRHLGDDELRLRYFVARAEVGALAKPIDETLALVERAAESARRIAIRGTVHCYASGAEIACRYGDLERARECVKSAEAVAVRSVGVINDVRRRVLKERTRIEMLAGDLPAARDLVAGNVGWNESGRHNESFDAGVAVAIGMRMGDRALVDAFFDPQLLDDSAAVGDAESCGVLLAGFGEVMLVRGMAKELRTVVARCVEDRLIDPYAAIALCAARNSPIECAVRAVGQAEEYLGGAIAPAAEPLLALCQATLLRRQGRQIAGAELATKAAARFRGIGWRLYEATALELAGDSRRASFAYGRCGASADVARLAAGETRKLKYAPFGARLSAREREVARLIAAKRSNRDIARALEISVRTVDHHVEAAFSKLGIRARWELTAAMLE